MKVILINGSPHKSGCTYTALQEVAGALTKNSIETETFWLGTEAIPGCIACKKCKKTGRCFRDDIVNEFLDIASQADGFVYGSPIHFASAAGMLTSFMDRVFYVGRSGFRGKPTAAIVSGRRGGASASFDQLNKYFGASSMPIVTSQYWNSVHGNTPEEVRQDLEGMQTMRTLGNNMAWLLKSIEAGKKAGIELPELEKNAVTNFIR